MARLKTGSIVADITGKVGDNIYSRNAGGPYVKAFAAPTIPLTPFVTAARDVLAAANVAWANIADIEALSWINFASRFPRSSFYDGYRKIEPRALFISCFINQHYAGITPAPSLVIPPISNFKNFSINLGASPAPTLTPLGGNASGDFRIIWYASLPQSSAVRSINSVPLYAFGNTSYSPGVPYAFDLDYFNRFGVSPLGPSKRVFISARVIHSFSGLQVGAFSSNQLFSGTETPFIAGITGDGPNNYGSNRPGGISFLAAYDGFVNSISALCGFTSGSMQFAIYSGTSSSPITYLGGTALFSVFGGTIWRTHPLVTPVSINAGSYYYITVWRNGNINIRGFSGGQVVRMEDINKWPPPATFSLKLSNNWGWSIYCNGTYFI